MKDFLFLIFQEMGFKFYRQGTLIDEIEPLAFFTYWNIEQSDEYADNSPKTLKNIYQVYFYCKEICLLENPNYLYDTMDRFVKRARELGLAVSYVQDVSSSPDKYIGRMCRVQYAQHE